MKRNTPKLTPDYNVGLKITRRGQTVATLMISFLFSGLLTWVYLLGPTTTVYPDSAEVIPPVNEVNCLVHQQCNPTWTKVTQELGDALAEGDNEPPTNADTRDWESCVQHNNGETVLCPDGAVFHN